MTTAAELRALADEIESLNPPDVHYGSFIEGDPRDFDFDTEMNSAREAEQYRLACAEAAKMPAWFFVGQTRLFCRRWRGMGLGGSYLEDANQRRREAAADLRARAALLDNPATADTVAVPIAGPVEVEG